MQWLACLLHASELPFRFFFQIDGGVMAGPRCSIGKTRRHLDLDPKDLPIKAFTAILLKASVLPDDVKSYLSPDKIIGFESLSGCLKRKQC